MAVHAAVVPSWPRRWSASRAPASRPRPEVWPTLVRAVRAEAAPAAVRAQRGDVRRELGDHLAVQGAVEQRRRQHRGPAEAGADLGVDGVGGDPGGAVHGQPAAEHVVAVRREAVAAAEPGADRSAGGGARSRRAGRRQRDARGTEVSMIRPIRTGRPSRCSTPSRTRRTPRPASRDRWWQPQRAGHRRGGGGEHAQARGRRGRGRARAGRGGRPGGARRAPGSEPVADPDRCRGGHGGRGSGGHASRR